MPFAVQAASLTCFTAVAEVRCRTQIEVLGYKSAEDRTAAHLQAALSTDRGVQAAGVKRHGNHTVPPYSGPSAFALPHNKTSAESANANPALLIILRVVEIIGRVVGL